MGKHQAKEFNESSENALRKARESWRYMGGEDPQKGEVVLDNFGDPGGLGHTHQSIFDNKVGDMLRSKSRGKLRRYIEKMIYLRDKDYARGFIRKSRFRVELMNVVGDLL